MEYEFTDGRKMNVGTMFCVGQNYSKHAKEMGSEVPKDPIIFLKPANAYIPDGGKIILPSISNLPHHEVELVVIIGKDCDNIDINEAKNYIAGYAVGLDITLRDIQNKAKKDGHPWAVAKGFRTSAPISKIIPSSQFGIDIPDFELELKVNGEIKQRVNTNEMERSVEVLISYLSGIFGLREGDCIFTGTPEGVGVINHGDKLHAQLKGYVTLEVKVE
ncbi:MAG: fumarylacetoacetate hydrolase family protein [Ignavibacteriae bacterium]|nr:fumarylacetoacetate hydrolase family protein [Ignavibacteriota bacterium]